MRLSHMAKKNRLRDDDQNSKIFHSILNAKSHKRLMICV